MRQTRVASRSTRHRQGAMPASALRTRFRTASTSAPAELDRARSNGVSPSNSGCGRFRNARQRMQPARPAPVTAPGVQASRRRSVKKPTQHTVASAP